MRLKQYKHTCSRDMLANGLAEKERLFAIRKQNTACLASTIPLKKTCRKSRSYATSPDNDQQQLLHNCVNSEKLKAGKGQYGSKNRAAP